MARFAALALLASSALAVHACSTSTGSKLVVRAFEPALNALFPRHAVLKRGSGDMSQIESEVTDLAEQAADQVANNGTCGGSSTCGGWLNLAETCASNTAQALCICGSDAISAATACANCLDTNVSSFCSAAISALSALSASASPTGTVASSSPSSPFSPSSPSATASPDSDSGAAGTQVLGMGQLASIVGASVALLAF
ncbi:hypothetical protein JCM1841_005894 [Sporobolomyces salmonicolor]